jgi:lysophospholipase L1-like esterase
MSFGKNTPEELRDLWSFFSRGGVLLVAGCLIVPVGAEETVPPVSGQTVRQPGLNPLTTLAAPVDIPLWYSRVAARNKAAAREGGSIRVIFDGSSTTDHWNSVGRKVWNEQFSKLHPFNFGCSGDTIQNLLWRLQTGQVDGIHPRVVLLMIGSNNLPKNTPAEIAAGIAAAVEEYRRRCPGATVVIEGLLPRQSPELSRRAREVNEAVSKLADGDKVRFLDFSDRFALPDGTPDSNLLPDGIHPNERGYQIWADAILPVVESFLSTKR